MEYEEGIREVRDEVGEAVRLIKTNHVGANLDEARRFLSEAGIALKAERFNESIALAKKAQLAAKPTTEYLLSKANELATGAEKSFGSGSIEEAVNLWKKAIEVYGRVKELADGRNEPEIVVKMAEVERTINENISKAEIAIDNREMLNLVDGGNSSLEDANMLFEDTKFGESNKAYTKARKIFKDALGLAEKRGFEADAEKIRGALGSIETSIEAALLNEIDAMLKSAEENFKERKFTEAERTFTRAITFHEGLEIQREELEEMFDRGRVGVIRAKLEQGGEKMHAAEDLFKDAKHYDAKEGYKESREYLERVADEASGYKLSKLVEELNTMIQACSQNIATATTALMDVNVRGVEPEIITVDSVARGTADFRRTAPKSTGASPTQFTTFRTVWDPNPGNRGFVWSRGKPNEYGELPRIKQWISDKNPNIYWFLLKIVNRSDYPVTEWNVTLYTEQALMITKAHLDDKRVRIVDSSFDTNKNRNKYVVSIPPELGVSIPAKGGTRQMYFETDIRCEDALKMEFGVSGVVKLGTTPQIEVPSREKRFTYACKYGDFKKMFYGSIDALASQVMENLQDSYRREIVQNFTNSFRLIRDFENYCKNRYAEPEILIDKLEAVYSSLRAAEPITKEEILPFVEENLDVIRKLGGAAPNVEAQKERGMRMCERLIGLLHQVKMGS